MKNILLTIALCCCAYSCTVNNSLYDWSNYNYVMYDYIKNPSEKSAENLKSTYLKIIKNKGSRKTPPPGVCADLGYILIKEGQVEEGKKYLEKEIELYPESELFISKVLNRISQ